MQISDMKKRRSPAGVEEGLEKFLKNGEGMVQKWCNFHGAGVSGSRGIWVGSGAGGSEVAGAGGGSGSVAGGGEDVQIAVAGEEFGFDAVEE